jgi:hypothetical protein
MNGEQTYKSVDKFDRLMGGLKGTPDVTESGPSTITTVLSVTGETLTVIVHTLRQREVGDWLFLQSVDGQGSVRLVLPPQVTARIAQQRDALTAKVRRRAGKEQAAARKARGELPGFLKAKKGRKGGKQ